MTILYYLQRVITRSRAKSACLDRNDLLLAIAYWYGFSVGQSTLENDFSAAISHICDYMCDREQDYLYSIFIRSLPPLGVDAVPEHIRQHFHDLWMKGV